MWLLINIYLFGRVGCHLYIPTKHERYGVKLFMLCESNTGYLSNFIIYTGATTAYPVGPLVLPKPFDEYKNPLKWLCEPWLLCYIRQLLHLT